MTLNRWDPFRDLLNLQEKLQRIVAATHEELVYKRSARWCPVADILETPDSYIFRVELPGVGRDNINLEVRGNLLILSGERPIEKEPSVAAYHRIERIHGVFERSFHLPGQIDTDRARANYQDGVLEIIFPKSETEQEPAITVVCVS